MISAPSGAGKTSLIDKAVSQLKNVCTSVSHTTRRPRAGEIDGTHYHFVTHEKFEQMRIKGEFLESANVHGNLYGTSRQWVETKISSGVDVILEIDWQGANQVRSVFKEGISIFVLPPSVEVLRQRLVNRGKDSGRVIETRMASAKKEISHWEDADYVIINDDFQNACNKLQQLLLGRFDDPSLQTTNISYHKLSRELLSN
ncbi:MAG: guanylate kinase [Cellvibrionales bacterium TMED49]|nr:guanylate kinase [Porticoccaceae bacterium]OUU40645.1 MAG: guanylate kinase [Cellvibrionales bacterium TMED49]